MDTSMDSITIEVNAAAKSSTAEVDNLTQKLDALRKSLEKTIATAGNFSKLKMPDMSSKATFNTSRQSQPKQPYSDYGSLGRQFNALGIDPDKLGDSDYATLTKSVKTASDSLEQYKLASGEVVTISEKTRNGLTGVKVSLENVSNSAEKSTSAFQKLKGGLGLIGKGIAAFGSMKVLGSTFGKYYKEATDYIEAQNLFTVTLRDNLKDATTWADNFSSKLYLDPANVQQYMGSFNSLITGLGVGSKKALTMSENMTQLVYDLASFKNLSVDTAYKKLMSGASGEIEPLRNVGIALNEATLQRVAYDYGIKENISDLSEATKVQLRYIQILRSSSEWQGDMAKTLNSPANSLRVLQMEFTQLGRAIENIFIPIMQKIIPVVAAVTEILQDFANKIAKLAGFDPEKFKQSNDNLKAISKDVKGVGNEADKSKKKINSMLAPFDELNNVQTKSKTDDDVGGLGKDYNLPIDGYDALKNLNKSLQKQIDETKKKIEKLLPVVGAVGTAFLAWKISKRLFKDIDLLKKIKPENFSWGFSILGAANFAVDVSKVLKWVKDIKDNGPNFKNVSQLFSDFVGSIGDVMTIFGQYKLGGALKIVQGVGNIVGGIKDMIDKGVNWDDAKLVTDGITNFAIGVGLLKGHLGVAGVATGIQGLTTVVDELRKNWKAIKKGDWSGVNKATMATAAIQVVAGIGVAIYKFKKKLKGKSVADVGDKVNGITDAVSSTSNGVTNMKSPLKSLAKNLGWGVVIIAEVSAAAILFVGAIDVLGRELSDIAKVWQPVIDNKDTVLAALGNGSLLLLLVGGVAAGLGFLTTATGYTIPIAIGVGTGVLAEISGATILFTDAINEVGKQLNNIAITWQPVIDNKKTVKTALSEGSKLLLAVGLATAAIGALSIVGVGALPLAIGAGTAMLKEVSKATGDFIKHLTDVGKKLNNKLTPELDKVNNNAPTIKSGLRNYKTFLKEFGDIILNTTKVSAIAGLGTAITNFIGLFTGDPIKSFSRQVNKTYNQTVDLNSNLIAAKSELKNAKSLTTDYKKLLSELNKVTSDNTMSKLSGNLYVDMKDAGKKLVTGFVDGMNSQRWILSNTINSIFNGLDNNFAYSNGYWFGRSLGSGIHNGIVDSVRSTIDIKNKKGKTKDYYTVRAYAQGGYPESGELFYANENGPEMVGRIGNRTAVANNDQIATTLTNVLIKALDEHNSNNNQPSKTVIYLGSKKIYEGYGDYIESENDRYGTNTIRI